VDAAHGTGSGTVPLEYVRVEEPRDVQRLHTVLARYAPAAMFYLRQLVFPSIMQHQSFKLTASGADLGNSSLFGVRLGFSGTPSDLLPRELGRCMYEPGSSGRVVQVLSSRAFVGHTVLREWTMEGLLRWVARSTSPRFHAFIDVGALITGIPNIDVARMLLDLGLVGMDGCVFVDDRDNKVVLTRGSPDPIPLHLCGVPPEKRFTFFDQVRRRVGVGCVYVCVCV
jgi:hypothetical protein